MVRLFQNIKGIFSKLFIQIHIHLIFHIKVKKKIGVTSKMKKWHELKANFMQKVFLKYKLNIPNYVDRNMKTNIFL